MGGGAQYYYAALGTEDTLFGAGVLLKVTITWDGSTSKLYLNDTQVQSSHYTQPTANWTANSVFDLGATEYMNLGGYNSSDDVIDEFSVSGLNEGVTVTVTPSTATLVAGQSQQFGASVSGASDTDVTWTVNPNVGTLTQTGLYTCLLYTSPSPRD